MRRPILVGIAIASAEGVACLTQLTRLPGAQPRLGRSFRYRHHRRFMMKKLVALAAVAFAASAFGARQTPTHLPSEECVEPVFANDPIRVDQKR